MYGITLSFYYNKFKCVPGGPMDGRRGWDGRKLVARRTAELPYASKIFLNTHCESSYLPRWLRNPWGGQAHWHIQARSDFGDL